MSHVHYESNNLGLRVVRLDPWVSEEHYDHCETCPSDRILARNHTVDSEMLGKQLLNLTVSLGSFSAYRSGSKHPCAHRRKLQMLWRP